MIRAETFLKDWDDAASSPVLVECDDGNPYVIKCRTYTRGVIADQLIARLGRVVVAPVAVATLVEVPKELVVNEPRMAHIRPGIAHGTLWIPDCSEREGYLHTDVRENRERYARLAVLFGWTEADDRQFIFGNDPPHLVYSVDHHQFFPDGVNWTVASLDGAGRAEFDSEVIVECSLGTEELSSAAIPLGRATDDVVRESVAALPESWDLAAEEVEALMAFLVRRRNDLT